MPYKDPEKLREYKRKWMRKHRLTHPDYLEKERIRMRIKRGVPGYVEKERQHYQNQRITVLEHYSGGHTHCACCSEDKIEFLTIDHINGGGTEHRRCIGNGRSIYRWLKNNGYPDGFRVLCMNCNMSIGHYGYCPHQKGGTDARK